jgi:hypothetical protein
MPVAEERGVTKAQTKVCPCEACKKGRGAPSKITPLSIHSYTSRPSGGWQKTKAVHELVTPTLFMGVELETSVQSGFDGPSAIQSRAISAEIRRLHPDPARPSGDRYSTTSFPGYTPEWEAYQQERSRIEDLRYVAEQRLWREGFGAPKNAGAAVVASAEEAVSLAEPQDFWHAKHDGSVSGPEFCSQPASLEYWYSIRDDLSMMFTSLLHAGVRSHVGDEAGMHISISLESFTDSEHLMRMATLINANPRWTTRMSQRTPHSMHWCQLGQGAFAPGREAALRRWAERVMLQGENHSEDRYSALNAQCGGQGRLEFRVPRGTLRIDRFYKNLEWVAAMIEFTANYAATDSATFMRWVMSQGSRYADLQAWFIEKFSLAPTTEPFEPARAVPSDRVVANTVSNRGVDDGSQYCGCGDGCFVGDCDSCREDEEWDEPEEYYNCPSCGEDHDQPQDNYLPYRIGYPTHYHYFSGDYIGPVRQYRPDGTEYQYDHVGQPIRSPEDIAAEEAAQEARRERQRELRNLYQPTARPPRITFEPVSQEDAPSFDWISTFMVPTVVLTDDED